MASSVLTLIRWPFLPMLPQCHVKDPSHSAESAGGRLHLNTHTPLIQRSRSGLTMPLSRHSVGTYPYNELTRNLSGNIRPQSSQLAELQLTDPGLKSGFSVREVISTDKKEPQAGNELSNILPKSSHARKKPPHHVVFICAAYYILFAQTLII